MFRNNHHHNLRLTTQLAPATMARTNSPRLRSWWIGVLTKRTRPKSLISANPPRICGTIRLTSWRKISSSIYSCITIGWNSACPRQRKSRPSYSRRMLSTSRLVISWRGCRQSQTNNVLPVLSRSSQGLFAIDRVSFRDSKERNTPSRSSRSNWPVGWLGARLYKLVQEILRNTRYLRHRANNYEQRLSDSFREDGSMRVHSLKPQTDAVHPPISNWSRCSIYLWAARPVFEGYISISRSIPDIQSYNFHLIWSFT